MTKKELEHYLKGGKFNAIYNPTTTLDIDEDAKQFIGYKLVVWQNNITT